MKKEKKYIAGIDGLRAIAVLMVLAYHLKLPFANGGFLGVTVFLVLSGFLITRSLLPEIEKTNTINLKNFWIRRIRRLLPAILTMALFFILISAVFNRVLFTKACSDLLSVIFGYNNWWQIFKNVSYFENAGVPSPFTHCWSLAVETQFYILYPLLLIFLARFKNEKNLFIRVTAALAIVSAALMWILFNPSKDPSRVYYGTDTRAFSLLFGSALAILTQTSQWKKRIPAVLPDVIGAFSLIGLFYMMIKVEGHSSFLYRGGQVLVSLLTVLVIFAVLNEDSILGKILSPYPLKWVADRSYGIYLWHYPIILLFSNGKKSAWWIILIEILLTTIISVLSYYYIETPIRRGAIIRSIRIINSSPETQRQRRKRNRVVKKSIKAVCAAAVLGLGVILCVAFVPQENTLNNIEELEKQAQNASAITEQKIQQLKNEESEENSSKEYPKTDEEILESIDILLIGDSVALGAADEFYNVFPKSISDAAVSRYSDESFGIYTSYVDNGWDGDGVIFALSTNGLLYDSLGTLKEMIGPEMPFFIVTARAPYVTWEESNNKEIYEFVESTDNTYLVDWYKASEGHSEYFVEDETHLSSEGTKAYIDCIKEAVLQVYKNQETVSANAPLFMYDRNALSVVFLPDKLPLEFRG